MKEARQVSYNKVADMPQVPAAFNPITWNKTGTWRYLKPRYQDKLAPCRESCPAGEDIEGYVELIKEEKYIEAYRLIREENPFPSVCGRVCYHPCEDNCNRKDFDRSVSINYLERFVADFALQAGSKALLRVEKVPNNKKKRNGKVAIIGSGPAGLTCAFYLAKMGYRVTIYEALSELGGILAIGIPSYRLPKEILKWEIDQILAMGIEVKANVRVGKDVELEAIHKDYDSVFLSTGVHKCKEIGVPGEELKSVYKGLEFLKMINSGEKKDLGETVTVIGGGNTAIDVARSSLRLGKRVRILYRRTKAEMPANDEEISEAEREGALLDILSAPVKIIGDNGRVIGIECARMKLGEPDSSGRRSPIPVKGSNFIIEADSVITAIREEADLSYLTREVGVTDGIISTDQNSATSIKGVFAGGDIIDQPHTVVHAIASGKRGAIAIDCYIRGGKISQKLDKIKLGRRGSVSMQGYLFGVQDEEKFNTVANFEEINLDYFETSERGRMPSLPVKERLKGFKEVQLGLSPEIASYNAERCFNCGTCTYCDNCYMFCPDISVLRKQGEKGYAFDYDHCKGCGICAEECPRCAIIMEEEDR